MIRFKKQDAEKEKLLRQLGRQEKIIQEAFLEFVNNSTSSSVISEISALLESGNIEDALDIAGVQIARMSTVLDRVTIDVGTAESSAIAARLGAVAVGVSFNPTDARTTEIMRSNRLQFISQVTESQRESTRQALTRAFETGEGPRTTAVAFRDSIGLTARQEQSVVNYRILLENNSSQALNRGIRDRRFDRTIRRAIDTDQPLTTDQIDRMVGRYRERFIQFRAETVARTEGVRAASQARDESLRQMIEETGIDPETVVRTWNVTNDDRLRDAHDAMSGQKVGLNEPFIDGDGNELRFPGDPAAPPGTTINCRCVISNSFST